MPLPNKIILYHRIQTEADQLSFCSDHDKSIWIITEYVKRGGKFYIHPTDYDKIKK